MTRKGTYYCRCVRDAVENLLYRPRCGGSVPLALIALSRSRRKSCGGSLSRARARCRALTHFLARFLSRVCSLCLSALFLRTSEFRSVPKCVVERGDFGHCPAAHVGVHLARTFKCTRQGRKIGGDPCVYPGTRELGGLKERGCHGGDLRNVPLCQVAVHCARSGKGAFQGGGRGRNPLVDPDPYQA